jgi:prepilin-type processing-associated H-X9-DG protein
MLWQEQLERRIQRAAEALGRGRSVADRVRRRIEAMPAGPPLPARRKGIWTMNRIAKLSAAAAAAALVVTVIWVGLGDGSGVAWAEVRDRIRNARTFSCSGTLRQEGRGPTAARWMVKEPGLLRVEFEDDQRSTVHIWDLNQRKALLLDRKARAAATVDLTALADRLKDNLQVDAMLANLKELTDEPDEKLGQKRIGARTITGFRTRNTQGVIDVWVDAKTGALVQIDVAPAGGKTSMTITDIRLDEPLEDGLFSLTPPEGYAKADAAGIGPFGRLLGRDRELARRAISAAHLDRLAKACHAYRQANEGKWPGALADLTDHGIKPEDLVNPRQPDRKLGYVYVQPGSSPRPDRIMIYEAHDEWGGGVNVACVDGHVEFVSDEATFKKRLTGAPEEDRAPAEKPAGQEDEEATD